jgi:outer membrane receptor protein involved in Fe transport
VSYSNGPFSWNLNGRYNSGGANSLNWNVPGANGNVTTWNVTDNHTGGSVYWDTRMAWRIKMGKGDIELFGNVQNLFDRDPPMVLLQGIGTQTAGGYDQIGRRFVAGVNMKF